ncbi:MAG: tetratricopeptide repeat protein [Capsulimonadaceae bacterium]
MGMRGRTRTRRPPEALDARPAAGRTSPPAHKPTEVPLPAGATSRWSLLLVIALLVIVTAIVFHRTPGNQFLSYDDNIHVYQNPRLNPVTASNVLYFWWHPITPHGHDKPLLDGHVTKSNTITLLPYEQLYAPVFFTTYAILAEVGRLPHEMDDPEVGRYRYDPHVFHTANVVMHIANVLLVFALLRLLIGAARRSHAADAARTDWAAAAGALLFGIHPVQVEPVSWITGLNNVLSGTFGFSAMYLYLLAARDRYDDYGQMSVKPVVNGVVRRRLQLAAALWLYILALLTKPITVALFPIAWLLDVLVVNRGRGTSETTGPAVRSRGRQDRKLRSTAASDVRHPWAPGGVLRDATLNILPWALFAGIAVAIDASSQPDVSGDPAIAAPFWFRPLLMADSFAFYLGKLVWPAALGVDYGRTPQYLYTHGIPYATCWVFLCSAIVLWCLRHRYPVCAVSGMILFVSLLPMSGIVPYYFHSTSIVADRYLYLSMLAPALALAEVLSTRPGRLASALVGILLLGLAIRSTVQTAYWHDSATIYRHSLSVNPNSFMVAWNYSILLFEQHKAMESAEMLERVVRIRPTDVDAKCELAFALMECGKIRMRAGDIAGATRYCQESLQWDPYIINAHGLLGNILENRGDWPDAEVQMRDVVELDENSAMAHYCLGFALASEGKTTEAMDEYSTALRLNPGYARAQRALDRLSRGGVAATSIDARKQPPQFMKP